MTTEHPRVWLERIAERLPLRRISQAEATLMEAAGLIRRRGTDVEHIRDWPPRPEAAHTSWQLGDPTPTVMAGLPGPNGQWIEVPHNEAEEAIARWRQDRESQRLGRLKGELTSLGVTLPS